MERLHTTEALRVDGRVVIPIQRVQFRSTQGRGAVWLHAFVEPRAFVIAEGEGCRAIGPDGEELALEPLLDEVPGLAQVVERERRCQP